MPQTKFVTSKALAMGLRPIVVLNKVDKPDADLIVHWTNVLICSPPWMPQTISWIFHTCMHQAVQAGQIMNWTARARICQPCSIYREPRPRAPSVAAQG